MSKRDERIGTAIGLHLRFIIMLVAGAVVATQIGWPWWAGAIAAWGLLILVTTPPLVRVSWEKRLRQPRASRPSQARERGYSSSARPPVGYPPRDGVGGPR